MSGTRSGFWTGRTIRSNTAVVDPFDAKSVDANAYNLRMGNSYFASADVDGRERKKVALAEGEAFVIPSGQFAFLVTKETIRVPKDAMAFISMRTGLKFQGLINVSGFHVDPGYEGRLIYAVFNASPSQVHLCEGDLLFKIWFADLDETDDLDSVFKGTAQSGITNEMVRGMSKENYSLSVLAEKLRSLEQAFAAQKPTVDALQIAWLTLIGGVVVAIVSAMFVVAWPFILELRDYLFAILATPSLIPDAPSATVG